MSSSTSGFARRGNGTCFSTEVDCGATARPFHACCPSGSFCPSQYNVNCCPTAANCTESLLVNPQCANRTLTLYDNNGYFCCLPGSTGAASTVNSDICAEPGYVYNAGEELLSIISTSSSSSSFPSSGFPSSSFPSSSPSTQRSSSIQPSDSTSPIPNSSHSPSSTSHAGAIAGALIGFAAIVIISILIWCVRRKKKKSGTALPSDDVKEGVETSQNYCTAELPVEERRGELADSVEASNRTELPASTGELRSPFELSSHQN